MRPLLAAAALVIASLLAGRPALAAPLAALPATVRVNIAGLGTSYAVISSTATLSAIGPDGTLLYRGTGRTITRTNVRTVRSAGLELPPASAASAITDGASRAELYRDARIAIAEGGPRVVVTTPFQFAIPQEDDPLGTVILGSERIVPIRFSSPDGLLQLDGRTYRGQLELAPDDEGDLIVVNTVATHDYLASVVGAEVPASWEGEMLAAQAIAARTYLYTHLGRHQTYDLEGDTRDQEYDGIASEDPRTVAAVGRTAGLIATYRGAPIEALYSANAGGVTEDSENVFANALPYLRSVPSPTDEVARDSSWGASSWRWTKELSATQLRAQLEQRGLSVGLPTAITLTQVSPTGRVLAARITGTSGTKDIGKDRARYYFGLRSALFSVSATPTGASERVLATDSARIAALDALGAHVAETAFALLRDASGSELGLVTTSYRYELPARFVFTGRGFGHGVGMSQWGGQGLALRGASYREILAHYYVGTTLTAVGGA